MKKKNWFTAAFIVMATTLFFGCTTPAQRVENAEDNVVDANEALDVANREYLADMETFRLTTAERIAINEQRIAEFRIRIKTAKRETRVDYENKIALLEQKNNDMRKSMNDYKANGKDNWATFKVEFNHDMDELNTALTSLVTNDVK